jgi:predicted RNase H-like HicB family nuclease
METAQNYDFDYYNRLINRIEIVEDVGEGGFVLSHSELKGCATSAESIERGIALLADAKVAWIEAAIEDGYPIKKGIN